MTMLMCAPLFIMVDQGDEQQQQQQQGGVVKASVI